MKKTDFKNLKKNIDRVNPVLKEFRDFINNRGSVVDLAVGVVIGGAFSKIVSSLVNDIIMPIVGIILGGIDFSRLELTIPSLFGTPTAAHLRYGVFIQNIVDFILVAFCIFIFVRLLNKLTLKKNTEKKTEKTTDEKILTVLEEIRDQKIKKLK